MPLAYSIPLFIVCLTVVVAGSVFLSRSLSRLGTCLDIPEQFMGFITAVGADSPEISAAVVAMLAGHSEVGVGVVFGSNLFNLAFLLGFTAVIAGRISVRRASVALHGGVGILATAIAIALVLQAVSPPLALGLLLTLLVPYAGLLALRRGSLERLPLPSSWKPFLISAVSESQEGARQLQRAGANDGDRQQARSSENDGASRDTQPERAGRLFVSVLVSLLVIVAGSTGLVYSATALTAGWLPHSLLGTLVLAALTGIPNFYTAVGLAQRGRASAVVTEAMNSNSLNLLVALAIPSLIFGASMPRTPTGHLDTGALAIMTVAVVTALGFQRGLDRKAGLAVIAGYLVFVALRIYLA